MSGEIIAILAVGAALAGITLTATRGLRQDINDVRQEVNNLHSEVGELRERMAHLEGLLEGLREAIIGRARAS